MSVNNYKARLPQIVKNLVYGHCGLDLISGLHNSHYFFFCKYHSGLELTKFYFLLGVGSGGRYSKDEDERNLYSRYQANIKVYYPLDTYIYTHKHTHTYRYRLPKMYVCVFCLFMQKNSY